MKRKTKAQREAEAKQSLYVRVRDVYSGAIGKDWDADEFATADTLSRVIPALHKLFGQQFPDRNYMWELHNLHHYSDAKSATDFLFREGFRA